MTHGRSLALSLSTLLVLASTALSPAQVSAQAFYVVAVASEGLASTTTIETELPAMARRCANAGSIRRLAQGQRVALVTLDATGAASNAEVRSDDVSPSGTETAFVRCLGRALRAQRYEAPQSQPAVAEVTFEFARTVPLALQPGGEGVRRRGRSRAPQATPPGTGLPPEQVREVASQHAAEVERCVNTSVEGNHRLTGRLELEMTILPDGHVEMIAVVRTNTGNEAFDRCVTEAARTWVFPAPGARVAIRYPLVIASEVEAPH